MEFRRVLFRSGLTFAEGATMGEPFTNGAFIGLHGSWNRKPLAGYKVVFVKFNEKGHTDRKSVVWGKSVSVRVDIGGRRTINKKQTTSKLATHTINLIERYNT